MSANDTKIPTVLGPVDTSSVSGAVLASERLLCDLSRRAPPEASTPALSLELASLWRVRATPWNCRDNLRLVSLDDAALELAQFRDNGGSLVMDATPVADGRDPAGLAELARRTGLHIVMGASMPPRGGGSLSQSPQVAIPGGGDPDPPDAQAQAEQEGRELERQLLFGVDVPDPRTPAAPGSEPRTVKAQAGFLLVVGPGGGADWSAPAPPRAAAGPGREEERPGQASPREEQQAGCGSASSLERAPGAGGEYGLTAHERAALAPAAWAQRATGAPLVLVASPFNLPWAVAALGWLAGEERGVDPSRVVVAGVHGGPDQPRDTHLRILRAGACLCFDGFARPEGQGEAPPPATTATTNNASASPRADDIGSCQGDGGIGGAGRGRGGAGPGAATSRNNASPSPQANGGGGQGEDGGIAGAGGGGRPRGGRRLGSDEETAQRVASLAAEGFSEQLLLSQGVCLKMHLTRYGGCGYGHVQRSVCPRLLGMGVPEARLQAVLGRNALRLLAWHRPPEPVETPRDYLECDWCGGEFERVEGQYFHKFQFVYCGSGCLRRHREAGFPPPMAGRAGGGGGGGGIQ